MRQLRLLLTTLRYTRLSQLLHRLRLLVRRRIAQSVRRGKWMPAWWNAPMPARGTPLDDVLCEGLRDSSGDGSLPYEVNLAGTPFVLDRCTDWTAPNLTYGTRLEKLHLHYMEYLGCLSPAAAEAVVLDWIRSNPPYERDYWKDSWNSYALSIRVVTWLRLLTLGALPCSAAAGPAIEESLVRQLRFLTRNLERDIGGNHLIRNTRALLWGAGYFTGPEADSWRHVAMQHLSRELPAQVLPDGMHFELSPAYHIQVFADLLECYRLLPDGPFRNALGDRLDAMAQVVVDLTHPDGLPSLFGDSGLHATVSPDVALALHEKVRGRRPRPRSVWRLEAAGYVGARSSSNLVIMDCGRIGPDHLPAHAHGDVFSFEWSVEGRRLIVDAGVAEYHPGPLRELSRSTRAHNTVTLDDCDQAEFWSAFRVARRPNVTVETWAPEADGYLCVARHDGFRSLAGNPIHRRHLSTNNLTLVVEDEILGGNGQEVVSRLLLHPDVSIKRIDEGMLLTAGKIAVKLQSPAEIQSKKAAWMPDFGVRIATVQLLIRYGSAPCIGGFQLRQLRLRDSTDRSPELVAEG